MTGGRDCGYGGSWGWEGGQRRCQQRRKKDDTHEVTAKHLMDITHLAGQRMQFRASLARLELALQTIEDMVESEATLAGWSHVRTHTAHASESLLLHRWSTLGLPRTRALRAREVECAAKRRRRRNAT